MDCIFCDIISKKENAEIVFENDKVLALLDINPINYGHTLVIPKKHYENFLTVDPEEFGELFKSAQFLAGTVKRSLNADGFNIVSNNGISAGQSVFHYHLHIIPRFENDFPVKPPIKTYSEGLIKEYGEKIRSVISKYEGLLDGK